jgi:hypothetical protein
MLRRPLAILTALAIADYLLWDWSVAGNHDVFAIISGLTLVPLILAVLWLLALTVVRMLARTAQGSADRRRSRTSATVSDSAGPAAAGQQLEVEGRPPAAPKVAA